MVNGAYGRPFRRFGFWARVIFDRARNGIAALVLYQPVKAFLEGLGFAVKGEIGGCDLLALRDGDPPVVVVGELKLTFNLELVLQGVDRAAACDEVWLAARLSSRAKGRENDARFRNLCRRLGFGLLGVRSNGDVEVLVSPTCSLSHHGRAACASQPRCSSITWRCMASRPSTSRTGPIPAT
jgi:hypothetical protein